MADDSPQPQPTPRRPEPVPFDDPRHARIHELLSRIGEGPASMYRDIRRLMSGHEFVENPASVLIHFVRELKSSIQGVLLPADFKPPEENGDAAAIDAILKNLGLPTDHAIGETWKKFKPHEIVHRRALGRPLRLEEVRSAAAEFERILEMLLDEMERSYALMYVPVDSLLAKKQPGKKDVSKLQNKVPQNGQMLGYFYSNADVDSWLKPLHDAGVFANAPSNAGWPALQFLKRAAEAGAARRVAEILASVPVPENSMHQMQYLEVIQALPVSFRPALLRRFAEERSEREDFVVRDLVDATAEIAPVDAETALAITTRLLQLQVRGEPSGAPRDFQSAFDVHTYGDVVNDAVPALVAAAPEAAFRSFADLLDSALTSARQADEDDLSVAWRTSIAPHEQNGFYEPIQHLGDAVITSAEAVLRVDRTKVDALVDDLEAREWSFFRRLALHLLSAFGDPTTPSVQAAVLRSDNLQSYELRREYHLLASKVAPHFSAGSLQALITSILDGPDEVERIRERDPEYAALYRERWIRDRLAWVADVLPADVRAYYDEIVTRLGEYDETTDFTGFITSWVGPESPVPAGELVGMPVEEIAHYLQSWQPPKEHFAATREGLGRELQQVAKDRPAEFSAAGHRFVGTHATYVGSILAGLEEAVKTGEPIDWEQVVKLSEWVVLQPRDIPRDISEDRALDDDPPWGWARGAIARLLQAGFVAKDQAAPPVTLRQRIWSLLDVIASDPDPDEKRDLQLRDPITTAINSTRGRALEAVMHYLLWVRGGVSRPDGVDNFEDMAEARAVLDAHLDVSIDPSPAIRAVYGRWLFFLDSLAPAWVEQHIPKLFPRDDADLEGAVLDAYLLYGQYTSDRIRRLLDDTFTRAIARMPATTKEKRSEGRAHSGLGQQLLLAYLAGSETFAEGTLLARYFEAADVETRAEGLRFAVHQLKTAKENVDAVRQRVVALWEWRVANGDAGELAVFGRWIGEERLDASWRLANLETALARARGLDHHYDVMSTLVGLVSLHPAAVLRCMKLAIETADRWRIYSFVHHGDARRVLEAAFAIDDVTIQRQAKVIANVLLAHDFLEFRDLAERLLADTEHSE